MTSRCTGDVMVVQLSMSLGSKFLFLFYAFLALFLVRSVSFEWSRSSLYYWIAFIMSALSAWLSVGESEITVLDKSKNLVWQEKKLPLRRKIVLVLGKLSDSMGVKIESDAGHPHLRRLVIKFEGKSFPLSDTFLDTRKGLFTEGAGLEDVKSAVNRFCKR